MPLRNPANDRFSLRLRPDLGSVWLFRIHCQEAAALGLSGLGCVTFFVYVLGLFSSPLVAPKVPLRNPANDRFFASPETGFRWCLAVSDPLPRGCRFGFVRARLCHVFCLRTGAFFFSFRGSKGATSQPFFASPETGFRWCFAVLSRMALLRGRRHGR